MNKNRAAQLRAQLDSLSPDDDMYQILLDEIMMLEGKGIYAPKKFKKGGKIRGAGIAGKGVRPAKMR
jgi:hypothetical protein